MALLVHGKSTLLRCISHLETLTKGEIYLHNIKLEENKQQIINYTKEIGMVFQQYHLFPHLTVKENIMLAPIKVLKIDKEEAQKEAKKLLKRIGLLNKENDYPYSLSGGQQQRIAIIRALAMKPNIMLFDEVTSALDPEMVGEVLELIKELADGGMTMIITTHEMGFARNVADKMIFMDDGKIIEQNKPVDFCEKPKNKRLKDFLAKVI